MTEGKFADFIVLRDTTSHVICRGQQNAMTTVVAIDHGEGGGWTCPSNFWAPGKNSKYNIIYEKHSNKAADLKTGKSPTVLRKGLATSTLGFALKRLPLLPQHSQRSLRS